VVDLGSLGTIELPRSSTAIAGEDVTLGIRPEHLTLGEGDFALETTPNIVEQLGIHTITYSTLPGGEHFTALFEGNPDLVEGKPVRMSFAKSRVHLFDAKGLAVY